MKLDLTVIIISHNHEQYFKNCLASLFKYSEKNFEVLFIENSLNQTIPEFIRKNYSNIKLFINKKPKGFAANCNFGIKTAKTKYILILNPDIEIKKNSIEKLYNFMEKHPKTMICGPKLLNPDGSLQYSARRFPNFLTFITRRTPLRFFMKNLSINKKHLGCDLDHSKAQKVDWLLGSALMIRKKFIEKIGRFDENFFLYVEDIDLCKRVWLNGGEVCYVPQSAMIHHHLAKSDQSFFSVYSWYHTKSMFYYFWKYNLNKIMKK